MVKRASLLLYLVLAAASGLRAEVSMTDQQGIRKQIHRASTRRGQGPGVLATGSISLVDSAGLKWFIDTDITFSTSSSASGAASEASYQGPIVASTSAGGTTSSSLSDAWDGYESICVSLTNATGPCRTGDANYTMYRNNGAASFDATVPVTPACTNRQVVFQPQTIGGLSVFRKVYIPNNDNYARWLDVFTNTSGAPITFTTITGNNLGSDSNTRIVSSSSGDNVATTSDLWVTTFQNFSGNTSSDPRLGHVLQGAGAPVPVSIINFADGDDNPFWGYSLTLAPGQTKSILNYAVGVGTKAAANAKAASLAAAPPLACLSATETGQISNFFPNLIVNPSFESGLANWTPVAFTGGDTVVGTASSDGAKSLQIVGAAGANKRVTQTIAVAGVAGNAYVLSGSSQTTGALALADDKYQVWVTFNNTDSTTSAFNLDFTRTAHSWQFLSKTFTTTKAYSSITVEVRYFKQSGTANFDGLLLRRTN